MKNPMEQLNEKRNAFNCRRDNRQVCERKTCHLGYHCFTETKDQWRKDIGLLFGEKLCRLEKLKDKVLSKDEEKECSEERHEHIEFPNTVTKGFLGDKSFFYPLAGQGDGKELWNSVLRFLDGGTDEAGLVGRGGKKSEEKIDLFCKKFTGDREAFRKNAQEVGFKLPALTYDKLKALAPEHKEIARTTARTLLRVYAELVHAVESVLDEKDRLVKYTPEESWCGSVENDPVCKYWCRKPKNWEAVVGVANESLALFEGCFRNKAFGQKRCTGSDFTALETKVKELAQGSADSEWLLTAEHMMGQSTDGRLFGKVSEVNGIVGFVTDPSKTAQKPFSMQVSAGSSNTCGITSEGEIECFGDNGYGKSNNLKPKQASSGKFVQVSVGNCHTCGLTTEGQIECFGCNYQDGRSNNFKPKKASSGQFVQVSAGYEHTCGLTTEGQIECFGKDSEGQSNGYKPKKASSGQFVQVSAGSQHTCGLTTGGQIECFGKDGEGQSNGYSTKKSSFGTYTQVSAGNKHTCGLTTQGEIECFGSDANGRSNKFRPKKASSGTFTQVSAGYEHTCGLTTEGQMECFGSDWNGRANKYKPKKASLGKFVQISAGYSHTCGLTTKGQIECFGSDSAKQTNGDKPAKPSSLTFKDVSAGHFHTCGLTTQGEIECFGSDANGRSNKFRPKKASSGTFTQVSAGYEHTCGLTTEGQMECFGSDWNGRANKYKPKKASLGKFVQISAGYSHTCGLTTKGQIECFGSDSAKQTNGDKPAKPSSLTFKDVSAGHFHTCGLTTQGEIECFGSDANGRSNKFRPKKASSGTFTQVSAGYRHTCGLTSEGQMECFGDNGDGQSNGKNPKKASLGKFVQVSAGYSHNCGVTTEGQIECFGSDGEGRSNGNKPKKASSGKFILVSAGMAHTCGLTAEGQIECFGYDENAQSNNFKPKQALMGNFVNLATGSRHTCGITSEGAIECFGDNGNGKSNNFKPKRASSGKFVQVSVGDSHTCGLTVGGEIECFGSDGNGRSNNFKPKKASSGKFLRVSVGYAYTCGLTTDGQIECFGNDGDGQANGYQPKTPSPRFFLFNGCYVAERRLDCDWNMNLFFEAGILVHKASAHIVLRGAVGSKLEGQEFDMKKIGNRVVFGSSHDTMVSVASIPYGKKSFWGHTTNGYRRKLLSAFYKRAGTTNASRSPMRGLLKKKASLEAKVDKKADINEVEMLKEQNAQLGAEVKKLKTHMGIVEGVVKSLRTNRPYPKKPSPHRKCGRAITPRWYYELLSDDRRREVAGCARTAVNLDLENTNAVDVKDLALNGGVAVHEEAALLELGSVSSGEVLDKQFVYKVEGEAPFLKESDLIYNFMTKQTEAVYDCKTTAKQVCSASEHSQKRSSLKVTVYEDKEWCCKSSSHDSCEEHCLGDLTHPRVYTVKVTGTKYEIHDDQKRRRLLVKRFRGGGGS
eukprot:g5036.t1